ncbi:DUF2513 domain-containing protein [Pontibacillus litoralis]|uniref:DUF2513 domain-containing protein n=1 Tax=Pontibacillus litoralis JSM 072002 TaxID=1385512 RepID=A0A0A5FZ32_9BACI|nr:DUF2513 domain-containing protein [Pontibacillus litoralis]KGX85039.1 hypothetical protein N784_11125 [Pontibacillus litoralis JSM 072002]
MKLSFDAMRDLLFVIEDQPRDIDINKVVYDRRLESFDKSDLGYALEKLIEARLLNGKVYTTKSGILFSIDSISTDGHEFLDNIRNDTNWNKIKGMASEKGVGTIKGLAPIATGVATAWLKNHLNL